MFRRSLPPVETLFDRYRREAVLLHRPYPPQTAPRVNSKFGGLPRLPAHYDWPRTSHGVPLHFLAQIDCAEIPFPTALPERGVLFFFGRDDDEQIWNYDSPASDDCRAIYALDAFAATLLRKAPDDLPPIGGYYPHRAWRGLLRPGEPGPALHTEWPIQPLRISSYPDVLPEPHPVGQEGGPLLAILSAMRRATKPDDTWMVHERRAEQYRDLLFDRREKALAEAVGSAAPQRSYVLAEATARVILAHAETGSQAYPQMWDMVASVAKWASLTPDYPSLPKVEQHRAAAEAWLRRAEAEDADAPVPEVCRREFRDWLFTLRDPKSTLPIAEDVLRLVTYSVTHGIRTRAGDRDRAGLISPHLYELMAGELKMESTSYPQMLGHAPSAQEPLAPDDPTVCLLNLASDATLGWMFGDAGNATFWISPGDLARRDFSQVWGTIEGH